MAAKDRFFTGLKAELGRAMQTSAMSPGVVYNLRLTEGGQIIPNLTSTDCERRGRRALLGHLAAHLPAALKKLKHKVHKGSRTTLKSLNTKYTKDHKENLVKTYFVCTSCP